MPFPKAVTAAVRMPGSLIPAITPEETSMTQYALNVVNNSTNYVDLCVFQTPPDLGVMDVATLAWFVEPAHPTTVVDFTWQEDYSFVWAQTGSLSAGVQFRAKQAWPADPSDPAQQQVQFTFLRDAYTFQEGTAVGTPKIGNLYIKETDQLPLNEASVGIGMAGAGTFAVSAQPNQNLVFTPHPEYWITAGTFTPGQVVDIEEMSNVAALPFPPGVFVLTAILNPDNTWTVENG
jgi:rhizosphere induced protein